MKKLVVLLLLLWTGSAAAQTPAITFNSSSVIQTMGASPTSFVLGHDYYDQVILKNLLVQDPGMEPVETSVLVQIGTQNLGLATYANDSNQYAHWIPGTYGGSTYSVIRHGVQVCSGTVQDTNTDGQQTTTDSNAAALITATVSGGSLTALSLKTTAYNGIANGTYNTYITGGGGSGAAVTFTVSGATYTSGVGYTGGTLSASIAAAGSGYSSAPTINVMSGFTLSETSGACSSFTGGFAAGDYMILRNTWAPTTSMHWALGV